MRVGCIGHNRIKAMGTHPSTIARGLTELANSQRGSSGSERAKHSTDQSEPIRLDKALSHNGPGLSATSTGGVDRGFKRELGGIRDSMNTSGAPYYLTEGIGGGAGLADATEPKIGTYDSSPRGVQRVRPPPLPCRSYAEATPSTASNPLGCSRSARGSVWSEPWSPLRHWLRNPFRVAIGADAMGTGLSVESIAPGNPVGETEAVGSLRRGTGGAGAVMGLAGPGGEPAWRSTSGTPLSATSTVPKGWSASTACRRRSPPPAYRSSGSMALKGCVKSPSHE